MDQPVKDQTVVTNFARAALALLAQDYADPKLDNYSFKSTADAIGTAWDRAAAHPELRQEIAEGAIATLASEQSEDAERICALFNLLEDSLSLEDDSYCRSLAAGAQALSKVSTRTLKSIEMVGTLVQQLNYYPILEVDCAVLPLTEKLGALGFVATQTLRTRVDNTAGPTRPVAIAAVAGFGPADVSVD